jgi:hypothetical protein
MDIVIKSEDDAWAWLKKALENQLPEDEPVKLRFDGWPSLDLKFKGQDFNQSVPTRIMPSLMEAQKEIHRVFVTLRYGENNLRRLRFDDREALELNVKVEKGSSEYITNLSEILNKIFESAVSKMSSRDILIALLSVATMWGSNAAWKNWLAHKESVAEIESRVQMSQLEKEKIALLVRSQEEVPETKAFAEGVDEFRNDSLHAMKPADVFELPNTDFTVDGHTAREITTPPREQAVEDRIDDSFVIQSVSSGEASGFRVRVKRVSDGQIINVTIADEALDAEQRQILQHGEWAKLPIKMELNVRRLRGEITAARLVKASKIERQDDARQAVAHQDNPNQSAE